MERVAVESDARQISLPAAVGRSPRLGQGYLLFVSPSDGSGIRRLADGDNLAIELWNGGQARVMGGPAIDPATRRIAFSVAEAGRTGLRVMDAEGTGMRTLAANLQVKGAPAWSPDGKSIVVAADQRNRTRLFRVPLDGTPAVPIVGEYSRDPAWSPDGNLLVYNGAEIGPSFQVKAIALPRGARRLVFLPGGKTLVVLKGEARDRNFWLVDLGTGQERQLTAFDPGFAIGDFDVSADGSEVVFDRLREESDVVQIDLAQR
jgi:Tol biopolymer transport system component